MMRNITMSFKVTVTAKTRTGETVCESYNDLTMDSCIRRTKRKYKGCSILTTTTRVITRKDKNIPEPPEGWQFARFKVKTKKNRWGREVNIAEEMNYEPMNGDERDNQKVSMQKP